jgi:predicted ArsR family transcriptional regulator
MDANLDCASSKEKVRDGFQKAHPSDLSISEVAAKVGVSANTASTYIKVLVAEGFLEQSRRIGNARLFRLKQPQSESHGNSDGKSRKQC